MNRMQRPSKYVNMSMSERVALMEKMTRVYWKACERLYRVPSTMPRIEFLPHLGGKACGAAGRDVRGLYIKYSLATLSLDPTTQIDETVRHEVAHVVAGLRYGTWGHDTAWKNVMRTLGAPMATRHS